MGQDSLFPFAGGQPFVQDPVLVPTSLTALTSKETWVDMITISNETGTAATITIQDGNGRAFLKNVSIAANTTEVIRIAGGRKFPGGLSWQAGTLNALTGFLRGLKKP